MQGRNSILKFSHVGMCGWTRILAAFLLCAATASAASAQTLVILQFRRSVWFVPDKSSGTGLGRRVVWPLGPAGLT